MPSVTPDRRRGATLAAGSPPEPGPRRAAPAGRSWRQLFDNRLLPVLLVLPAVIVIGGLVGYPVVRTMWLSFTDADLGSLMTGDMDLVGFDNYVRALEDPTLRRATVATVIFGLA